jgi:DNA polymerase-3 subunit gamma/tau
LWQQILAGLELPSTRMLLSQQARLVRLDDRRAVVQVAGPWAAMVESRRPLLERAVASALGGSRELKLETGGEPPPRPPEPQRQPPPPEPLSQALPAPAAQPVQPPAPPRQAEPAPPELNAPAAATPTPLDEQARRLAEFFNGDVIQEPIDEVA